ncbi:MAG: glycosyltransferase family 2 protein [Chloroflexi bacterium]|nr:glycosyltransferase family 2 protein [Chloroflexota bacterium]
MKLSTVIVNYNTRDEVLRAVESLIATGEGLEHEILVVDNASRDGSAAAIREQYPSVTVIETGANLWFTGGNNAGISASQGDYVLSLNPDTVACPGMLQTMVAYLAAHPEVGAVTCRMEFPDGTLQRNCSRLAAYTDMLFDYTLLGLIFARWRARRRQWMWYADWDRLSDYSVEVAPDSNLMVRRSVLDEVQHYDEGLKLYFTEDDLCRRILEHGHEIHYVAGATLIHAEHASTTKVQRLATQVYFDDLIAYARKYFGRARALLLGALIFPTRAAMYLKHTVARSR